MTRRFSCKAATCEQTTGTEFTHGLTLKGVATAPDMWSMNFRGIPIDANSRLYLMAAPGTTSMWVATATGAATGLDLFASIFHSVVK